MEWFGYMGKILRIDLSRETSRVEELRDEDIAFLGGSGLAAKIIFEEVDPKTDPLGEFNKLVIMTGPLTGTIVPGSSRFTIAAKSPLTDAWGETHLGGFFGPELKFAGYDGVIIQGKASSAVYIRISDDEVEIMDASSLWGLETSETEKRIRKELGDPKTRVLSIGPAGEKLVRYAVPITDERVGGRTGMGAVMGSKLLKAIAVGGSGRVPEKERERIRYVIKRIYATIMSYAPNQMRALYGTNGEMEIFYEYGDLPIKNFTKGVWDGVSRINGKVIIEEFSGEHKACFNCPVHCWKVVQTKTERFPTIKGRAPEYETAGSFGSLLLNDDPESLIVIEHLCNEYGIDTISTGVTIAWAIECFEKGVIDEKDTDGLKLEWGNPQLIIKLLKLISKREGFGDILAEGTRKASKIIGRGSYKYAMHVKGTEIPMHDPRAFKGLGLQYATSNRGADHLQGGFFRIEQGERQPDLKLYERVDRFQSTGKGWMVALMEDWHEVIESLGLCKFVSIPPGHVAGFYSMITGITKRVPDLLVDGERIFNLKRIFNVRAGTSRKDDVLPERFLFEPLNEGGAKGQVVELDIMLREYYEHRGWDEEGIPKKETLEKLGLSNIVKRTS